MTNMNRILNIAPVANRQLIGGSMVIDSKNQYRAHLKLGKWRITDVEATTLAGTGDDICPKRLHS